jgi:hypothetical protein
MLQTAPSCLHDFLMHPSRVLASKLLHRASPQRKDRDMNTSSRKRFNTDNDAVTTAKESCSTDSCAWLDGLPQAKKKFAFTIVVVDLPPLAGDPRLSRRRFCGFALQILPDRSFSIANEMRAFAIIASNR